MHLVGYLYEDYRAHFTVRLYCQLTRRELEFVEDEEINMALSGFL
jgi:hypothetical protein